MAHEVKSDYWRILIVDDHPVIRAGIGAVINNEPDMKICAEAAGQQQAWQAIQESPPDLAIIDISLEEGSGFSLIRRIRTANLPVEILVLSMHDESLYAERALRAGARGYISKQEATDHVATAIRKVLAGKIYLSEAMTERLLLGIAQNADHSDGDDSPISRLSDRELEVFWLIGEGVGATEIANRLHLSVKTIETHRDRIKKKLGLDSASELNRFAMQWLLEHPHRESA